MEKETKITFEKELEEIKHIAYLLELSTQGLENYVDSNDYIKSFYLLSDRLKEITQILGDNYKYTEN